MVNTHKASSDGKIGSDIKNLLAMGGMDVDKLATSSNSRPDGAPPVKVLSNSASDFKSLVAQLDVPAKTSESETKAPTAPKQTPVSVAAVAPTPATSPAPEAAPTASVVPSNALALAEPKPTVSTTVFEPINVDPRSYNPDADKSAKQPTARVQPKFAENDHLKKSARVSVAKAETSYKTPTVKRF